MEEIVWALSAMIIVLFLVAVYQLFQIRELMGEVRGLDRWRRKGLLIPWVRKNMSGSSSEVGIDEAIGLILKHLDLQIRKETTNETVIEKRPKPTKKQIEGMSRARKMQALGLAQQPSTGLGRGIFY